ncbi:MAG: hypothetical protein JWR07_471 [Nevskia sp.]|nr:hypothetical protein [Nevskia sp.]
MGVSGTIALGGGFFAGMLLWPLLLRAAHLLWTAFKHSSRPYWRFGVLPLLLIFNPAPWVLLALPYLTFQALSGQLHPYYWTWFLAGIYAAFGLYTAILARALSRGRKRITPPQSSPPGQGLPVKE